MLKALVRPDELAYGTSGKVASFGYSRIFFQFKKTLSSGQSFKKTARSGISFGSYLQMLSNYRRPFWSSGCR